MQGWVYATYEVATKLLESLKTWKVMTFFNYDSTPGGKSWNCCMDQSWNLKCQNVYNFVY